MIQYFDDKFAKKTSVITVMPLMSIIPQGALLKEFAIGKSYQLSSRLRLMGMHFRCGQKGHRDFVSILLS